MLLDLGIRNLVGLGEANQMEFKEGDIVRVSFMAKKPYIQNGKYQTEDEPSLRKQLAIVVAGHGLAQDEEFIEFVPAADCFVPERKRDARLLQLTDPYFRSGLAVNCGLVATSPKESVEKMKASISSDNLSLINSSVKSFLTKDA